MSSEYPAPRRAAEAPPPSRLIWWIAGLVILALVVTAIILVPRFWSSPAESAEPTAVSPSPTVGCTDPQVIVAVSSDYASQLESAAKAHNSVQGSCAVEIVSYANAEQLTGLATAKERPAAAFITAAPVEATTTAVGGEVTDGGVIGRSVGVVAVPETLVSALGWNGSPSWADLSTTLPNGQHWTSAGHPDLGSFNLALAQASSSGLTRGFLSGMAGAALSKDSAGLTQTDLVSPPVQNLMLGLVRQATITADEPAQLVEKLRQADAEGKLASTVSAAILDEQAVRAYNAAKPKTTLKAFYPKESAVALDVRYLVRPDAAAAAKTFGEFLTGAEGQKALKEAGLRGADGSASESFGELLNSVDTPSETVLAVPGEVATGLVQGWSRLTMPGRFLVLMDVSGSMAAKVPRTSRTRLQFAQEAAITGMQLVPPKAEIGLWEFSTHLDGDKDYRELVPVGPIKETIDGKTRLEALIAATKGLTPHNDTGMYDTALAGFRAMKESYSPGQPNVVVLITDGRNDDSDGISLAKLKATLQSEQDPDKPVRFLTLAFGRDADAASLAQIAKATGGSAFRSPNPADIGKVFFQALTNG